MNPPCKICTSSNTHKCFEKDRVCYYRCADCTFVFSEPTTNANFQTKLEDYEEAYIGYLQDSVEDPNNFASLVAWMSQFRTIEGVRVLDIGCGSGKFVRYLRHRAIEAYGVEPSHVLYEHFLSEDDIFFNLTVDGFRIKFPHDKFDIVTAFDVIEHVDEPVPFVENISQMLKPQGLCFVSTLDVASVPARVLGKRWHFYNKYHMSYWSRDTLAKLASKSNLSLLCSFHCGRFRSVGYMLRYLFEFVFGRSGASIPRRLDAIYVSTNLFDTLCLCFGKNS